MSERPGPLASPRPFRHDGLKYRCWQHSMKRRLIIVGLPIVVVLISAAVIFRRPVQMTPEALSDIKAQLLQDFVVEGQNIFKTNEIMFVAFGKEESRWIDPPSSVLHRLQSLTHCRCVLASELSPYAKTYPLYSVSYVDVRWKPEAGVYECEVGRYDGSFAPDVRRLSGYVRKGVIRRAWFKWEVLLTECQIG